MIRWLLRLFVREKNEVSDLWVRQYARSETTVGIEQSAINWAVMKQREID